MPDITPKLGLKKPVGTEAVTRAAYNENLDILDSNAADKNALAAVQQNVAAHLAETVSHIKTYTSLSELGLTDDLFSETNFGNNLLLIINAMEPYSRLTTITGSFPRLINSLTAQGHANATNADVFTVEKTSAYIYPTRITHAVNNATGIRMEFVGYYDNIWGGFYRTINFTISTADPSGGQHGDIWIKYVL